jgi:putative glycerol-1-phosphate prenyltransferase
MREVLQQLQTLRSTQRKGIALLIDPDSIGEEGMTHLLAKAEAASVDFLFIGGSLMTNTHIHTLIPKLKSQTTLPIVLFPGSLAQIAPDADALLFLSLISGRNAELLIGAHVTAAPLLRQTSLEVIPTGYMLIESGRMTTAHYISNTLPIPHEKPDIAACTAMAGEMLGLRLMYLDGGSGAEKPISSAMIAAVRKSVDTPIVIGGGIRSAAEAQRIWAAGADVIVIGNALEKDPNSTLLEEISATRCA